jgi:leader peptidase (prepilin peptidase)/N-methyltransferase
VAVALAAILGSFLNVCIALAPQGKHRLAAVPLPRCDTPIRAYDNIPLVRRRPGRPVRTCRTSPGGTRGSATVAAAAVVLWQLGPTWDALRAFVLVLALIAITFTDLEHRLIPDWITLPGIVVGLAFQLYPSPRAVLDVTGCVVAGGSSTPSR